VPGAAEPAPAPVVAIKKFRVAKKRGED